ncbi:MAG: hypothetical protein KC478_10380 [Bacteriovoracaceae bacterium]|nr:hypothetical protein [Bacteriovoracaceae bacterium]
MKKLFMSLMLLMFGLSFTACDADRDFEDTSEEIGESFEEAGDTIDDNI